MAARAEVVGPPGAREPEAWWAPLEMVARPLEEPVAAWDGRAAATEEPAGLPGVPAPEARSAPGARAGLVVLPEQPVRREPVVMAEQPSRRVAASCDCTFKGQQLWGKVQMVDSIGFPDFKVRVTSIAADLKVQQLGSTGFPTSCGKWQIVDSLGFPDFKVQVVTIGEDFSIQYDDTFPGLGYPP